MKIGVDLSQSISTKVADKITRTISTQLGVTIATQTTYSEAQPITLKADKLTAIQSGV